MKRREVLKAGTTLGVLGLTGASVAAENPPALHVPAEEQPHELTFMQWPVSRKVYSDRQFLAILQQTIADIAKAIARFEPVVMLAAASDHRRVRPLLSKNVELWDVPTEDLWCRDSGPLFAKTAEDRLAVSHIQFNGWGNKQVHRRDGQIASTIAERLDIDLIPTGLAGEAGGIEHDGQGLLMAHESSWVNNNRNRGLSRDEIEARLLKAYGAERMIWSPGVWGEDITDYHIDSLARFTGPGRVLINLPDDPDMGDPFHVAALDTHDLLVEAGLKVEVIPEPEERRITDVDFVASYANYYVCNGAVIAAQFGDDEADELAVKALRTHYPSREVVTLNVDALARLAAASTAQRNRCQPCNR